MATDNFNRSAGDLGANWTTLEGDPEIDGTNTRVAGNGAFMNHTAYYSGASFTAAQYSEVRSLGGSAAAEGPAVRLGSGPAGYVVIATNTSIKLYGLGAVGEIKDYGTTVTSGDLLRLEVVGSTLTLKKNGTAIGTPNYVTNTVNPTGAPGFFLYGDASVLDDFEAGDLTGIVLTTANPSSGITEQDIRDGGLEIIATLSGSTYIPA